MTLTNPTGGSIALSLSTTSATSVLVDLIDLEGRHWARLYEGHSVDGKVHLDWDWRAAGIGAGAYFVRARTGQLVSTRTITLVP